jgi:TonB family protein
MIKKRHWLTTACGCFILNFCVASSGAAQTSDIDYKSLYAAAEYDKALQAVASLDTIEAQQYKALCLLALGRQTDASSAIEALVNSSPTFIPSSEDAPPRFVELVTKVRQKMLPSIARKLFTEGRERYTEKQNDEALRRFSLVLTLLNDPAFSDTSTKQDLETLAKGFIDLANAAAPPAKTIPAAADAAPATPPEPTAASAPASAPAPAGPPAAPPKVTQPTALLQTVPPLPSDITARAGLRLVLVVLIDATGRVTSTSIKESAHPRFDMLVAQAARNWRYTPATRNGVPIPSEQVVTIQVDR